MSDSWNLAPGERMSDGLIAMDRLGGGEDNEVYLAWHEPMFSLLVAKLLRPSRVPDDRAVARFLREADVLRSLNHPVIVRLFDVDLSAERPTLLMEHLDGPSLGKLMRRHGRLSLEQTLPLALQLCSALHFMHERGFVHLDVKPDNVVMTSPPRLIDFSIARSVEEAAKIVSPLGTDAYMAPEQCDPSRARVGPQADVWGLGATLFHAVSGRVPYASALETLEERFPQIDRHPDPLPEDVPEQLRITIFACLDPDPDSRPSPESVAMSLEALVSQMPRKPILSPPKPRWKPRKD